MAYETTGYRRSQAGKAINPVRRQYVPSRGMGIEIGGRGAGLDPSTVWGFYILPGTIGLIGLFVVSKIFGAFSKGD